MQQNQYRFNDSSGCSLIRKQKINEKSLGVYVENDFRKKNEKRETNDSLLCSFLNFSRKNKIHSKIIGVVKRSLKSIFYLLFLLKLNES